MSHITERILAAYRLMYLRGLLMDGQYRLPKPPAEKSPTKGSKVIQPTPAFEPGRRRVLVATATAAAVSICANPTLSTAIEAGDESNTPVNNSRSVNPH